MDWLVPTSVATNYITNGDGVIQDVLDPIVFGGGEEAACPLDWDAIAENLLFPDENLESVRSEVIEALRPALRFVPGLDGC